MKNVFRYLLACGSVALAASIAVAQTDPSGHWEGAVDTPNGSVRLALDLAKNEKGVWVASLGVPEQKLTGLRVSGVSVEGGKVHLEAPDLPNSPAFELALTEGKLTGSIVVQSFSVPLELQRTGDAKVDIAAPDPAVSKELEGDWEGTITVPNGQSRDVIIHFKNLPDKTVEASIESPSHGVQGVPLKGVVQKGAVVEFAVLAAGGSYKGTLNKEGTEITGEWTQRTGSGPFTLILKKK